MGLRFHDLGRRRLAVLALDFLGVGVGVLGDGELGSFILAVHLSTKSFVSSLEELMVISSELRTTSYASEVPSVELSCEACVLGLAEVCWKDSVCELLAIDDDKRSAMRQPRNGIGVCWGREDLHQSLRKDLGILVHLFLWKVIVESLVLELGLRIDFHHDAQEWSKVGFWISQSVKSM